MPYVYDFDHDHGQSPLELRGLLGGKGAGLAEMAAVLRLPVPPGFTIETAACQAFRSGGYPPGLDEEIAGHLERVGRAAGRRFADPNDPLLLSVRSGAEASMPGMMDTVLNLGLNPDLVEGLAAASGDERFAWDCYLRLLTSFGSVVCGVDAGSLSALRIQAPHQAGGQASTQGSRELAFRIRRHIAEHSGREFPDDPWEQLHQAVAAVFGSWDSHRARSYRARAGIPDELGTAVTIQAMVFGNRDAGSGTGVVFTRDPNTGEPVPYGDFLSCAQGEEVVGGEQRTEDLGSLAARFPAAYDELVSYFPLLESRFADLCDIEFTIEQGRLWVLQARVGKRSAAAALRIAVDLASGEPPVISRAEALSRVTVEQLEKVAADSQVAGEDLIIGRGLGASPGVASGRVYFDPDDCVAAADRGERVLMVTDTTSPEHVHGMQVAEGILTATGGLVSHAAVVARGWGIPAVVGVSDLKVAAATMGPRGKAAAWLGGKQLSAGDLVTIDGTAGVVLLGDVRRQTRPLPDELAVMHQWATEEAALPTSPRRASAVPHLRGLLDSMERIMAPARGERPC